MSKRLLAILMLLPLLTPLASCGGGGYDAGEIYINFFGPTEMAVEPFPLKEDGAYLYVINAAGGSLSIMNTFGFDIIKKHEMDVYSDNALWLGNAPVDLAITPTGQLLYVTDAWNDAVRTVDTADPYPIAELDLVLEGAHVSIVPVSIDLQTYDPVVPAAWDERHEVWFSDPVANRLLVWDHRAAAIADEVALPATPIDLQVSRDGERVFIVCLDGALRVVEAATRTLLDITVDLGGYPRRVVESREGDLLFVLNIDPPELQIVETATWEQTDDEITFPMAINGMAISTDGRLGFITSDDGFVYYFFVKARRACGSSAEPAYFYDYGPQSNPTIEQVDTTDCVTRDETWMVTYDHDLGAWEVSGSRSGRQFNLAYTGQAYISDQGHVSFLIREGRYKVSDEDRFRFRTRVGVAPITVGTIPVGVAVTPYTEELAEDLVFVANSGSHTISRLYTGADENLGAIE
ncbi:MAG: YncE family protein [Alphaproteobacteria bacterium]